ncbi:MAG TPA: zinc ribbon domain-containing protein [Anaerolineae bacterium]|nr:zinc ribbon domain-containing protein [Anaerolineae bacterium]
MVTCPNCGNQAGEGAVFCDQCGTQLSQPETVVSESAPAPAGGSVICPACGAGNVPGEMFCDYCGSPLEPPVPAVEQVAELEPVSSEAELVVEVAPPEPVSAEVAAQVEAKTVCPACGAEVLPGEAFCADCGASLAQPPIPPEPVPEAEPAVEPEAPAAGVLAEVSAPEEEAAEAALPSPPPAPVPAGPATCPACGAEAEEGDAFCSTCGYALKPVPAAEPVAETPAPTPVAPVPAGPRLVVVASGAEIPLQAGDELSVGREDPVSGVYPDIDLTPHGGEDGGVSRRHARLVVEGGNYFVEDLDSTNFTFVNKQKVAPKTRQQVTDGDEIRFGRVALTFRS